MLEKLYRGLTGLAAPAVPLLLDRRARAGKEDPDRRHERLGRPRLPRPPGPLAWVHAASVGESLAVLPLIGKLLAADAAAHVLVTTGTVTSARLLATRLPQRALHQYVPVDLPAAVERFVAHWRPDLALWVESELWPNLLMALARHRIPAALVNARMSEKSARGWVRVPGTAARLLSPFRLALAQTQADAARLRALGLGDIRCVGNLKFSGEPPPADPATASELARRLAGRPVWLFASTHPGEEALAARVHLAVKARLPDSLLILAPRHPARGAEIAAALAGTGLSLARRGGGEALGPETDLYLADTLGEMGLWYRLAQATVMGGSFVPIGGHNPIESALLDCPLLLGPDMHNFAEVADALREAGGCLDVTADALPEALVALLADAAARQRLAAAARTVADANRGAVDRVMAALAPLLAEAGFTVPAAMETVR